MEKNKILDQLFARVNHDLALAMQAEASTSSFKYESDMKQESKYDTRSIEASYLADGQKRRIEELKLELKLLEEAPLREYSQQDEIAVGALVELETNNLRKLYFLSTTAGGTILNIDGIIISVVSVFSPIGNAILGLKVDDSFELKDKEYFIRGIS